MIRAALAGFLLLLTYAGPAWGQGGQYTPVPHQFLIGFNAFGRPIGAQPQFFDLSDATAWIATFTPALSCATGSLTSASATARYKTLGKTVVIEMIITITTNGTCAGYLVATLPSIAQADAVFSGRETNSSGNMLQAIVSTGAGAAAVLTYNGAYPGGNGFRFVISGIYESQ